MIACRQMGHQLPEKRDEKLLSDSRGAARMGRGDSAERPGYEAKYQEYKARQASWTVAFEERHGYPPTEAGVTHGSEPTHAPETT